jgi:RNA polymerase sigma-70 factor (ECF subfamily)
VEATVIDWTAILDPVPAAARGELAVRLARELAAARARWPDAAVTDDALGDAIRERAAIQRDPAAALARLRVEDLLLARWCATGDPRAITAFERTHRNDLDAIVARFRRLAVPEDELRQVLRIKLFVGEKPRISEYSGFGFLQNWVRVTALRALVDVARRERTRKLEELLADDDLLGVAQPSAELAARYSRAELSHAVKQAFARAVADLAPRQRNFLRHAHVDALTLDQIAALYGVHRATVARTLAQARAELMSATRRELGEQLGIADSELDSVVRSADSRIDLSLSRVLAAPELAEGSDPP